MHIVIEIGENGLHEFFSSPRPIIEFLRTVFVIVPFSLIILAMKPEIGQFTRCFQLSMNHPGRKPHKIRFRNYQGY